jgi:hypothetical protein
MADETQSRQERPCVVPTEAGASIEYLIDSRKGIVFMRAKGRPTAAAIQSYAQRLRQDARFAPTLSEIVDLREVECLQITPMEAISLADNADPFAMTSRRAFVTRNEWQANFANMHLMLRSPARTIRIFDNMEAAEQWIGSSEQPSLKRSARILPFIFR